MGYNEVYERHLTPLSLFQLCPKILSGIGENKTIQILSTNTIQCNQSTTLPYHNIQVFLKPFYLTDMNLPTKPYDPGYDHVIHKGQGITYSKFLKD